MSTADRADQAPGQPTVDHSLEDLLQLVADGQSAPFRQIYDRTSAGVFGAATSFVRDRSSAEDVTRGVFLDVWQLAGGFDPAAGSVLDWMMVLTRAQSIQCLRRRRSLPLSGEQPTGAPTEPAAISVLSAVVRQGGDFLSSLRPITPGLTALAAPR